MPKRGDESRIYGLGTADCGLPADSGLRTNQKFQTADSNRSEMVPRSSNAGNPQSAIRVLYRYAAA